MAIRGYLSVGGGRAECGRNPVLGELAVAKMEGPVLQGRMSVEEALLLDRIRAMGVSRAAEASRLEGARTQK